MFKNLKQKTINTSQDSSVLSSRSLSSSSLNDDVSNSDPNVSVISNRYQSLESLSSVTEEPCSTPRAVFGNLEDIIDDLKNQICKKDSENKKLQKFGKEAEKRINELVDNWNREVEGRQALERAYEKLEDSNEVQVRQLRDQLNVEKASACNQLQNQIERLKKDNEKLSKKNNSADSVAWQNKAESIERAYQELLEIQEHSEIQVQKMKDLLKLKDDDLQALQNKFDETEERCRNIQANSKPPAQDSVDDTDDSEVETVLKEDLDALNWQVAKYQQEIETLEKQVVKLEIELEEVQQKVSDKDFRINRLREDIKNKDLVIDTLKCDAAELTSAVDRTTNLLTDTRTELEATRSSYTKSLNDLQEDINSITDQYRECKSECKRQTELVEQLQIAASATKTLKTNLQDDLDSWKSKYHEGQAEVKRLAESQKEQELEFESLSLKLGKQDSLSVQVSSLSQEIAALQQNEEELKQECEYLTVARESWIEERNDLEADYKKQLETQTEKNKLLREEVELFRRSNQSTILPVSRPLQAKFTKGVTEVDMATRKETEGELADLRQKYASVETELSTKTKQLKQSQAHLADMKKTLQTELRGGANISPTTSRASPAVARKQNPVSPILPHKSDIQEFSPNDILKGYDGDPVNIEYLKHCVIKYICCLDNEASYLVRVISVLLQFTAEENSIVQDALTYKASWFKAFPPKSLRKLKSTKDTPGSK